MAAKEKKEELFEITLAPKAKTFVKEVKLQTPFGEGHIDLKFNHLRLSEVKKLVNPEDGNEALSDLDLLLKVTCGWGLSNEFNRDNVAELLDIYPGSVAQIMSQYMMALTAIRAKN